MTVELKFSLPKTISTVSVCNSQFVMHCLNSWFQENWILHPHPSLWLFYMPLIFNFWICLNITQLLKNPEEKKELFPFGMLLKLRNKVEQITKLLLWFMCTWHSMQKLEIFMTRQKWSEWIEEWGYYLIFLLSQLLRQHMLMYAFICSLFDIMMV